MTLLGRRKQVGAGATRAIAMKASTWRLRCALLLGALLPACTTSVDSLGGRGVDAGRDHEGLEVPAARHWVSSGRYVRVSDTVTLSAEGAWTTNTERFAEHGPEGTSEVGGNCKVGELAAIIGFDFPQKTIGWRDVQKCVGLGTTLVADRAGILYLGANDDDASAADANRTDNAGSVWVTIESEAPLSPTLAAEEIAGYDFATLDAEILEVRSEHLIFEQPKSALIEHQSEAWECLERYEALYLAYIELTGQTPENPIRFAMTPSASWEGSWSEPLRVRDVTQALSDCGNLARNYWVWVHMLGYNFHHGMKAEYRIGSNSSPAYSNLSATYGLEKLGMAQASNGPDKCPTITVAKYEDLVADPWAYLCLLLEIKATFGWAAWEKFFRLYYAERASGAVISGTTEEEHWTWFRETMNRAAKIDVSPVLEKYFVPLK